MSKNLETAKEIIKKNLGDAVCGIFDSRNIVGDYMENLYDDGKLKIDICYGYSYFEVFGLTTEEFEKLKEFYNKEIYTYRNV